MTSSHASNSPYQQKSGISVPNKSRSHASISPITPGTSTLADILDQFIGRYANAKTGTDILGRLQNLFQATGRGSVHTVGERDLHDWITAAKANNSVRLRLSTARTFFGWCHRHGYIDTDPTVELGYITKQYPKTYGKVQSPNPARWLDHEEAFDRLVGACQDGTVYGLRDEIVMRLGLAGMRAAEIAALTIADLRFDQSPPQIHWIGKGRRPRHVVAGSNLVDAVERYLLIWQRQTGRRPRRTDYVINSQGEAGPHAKHRPMNFGAQAGPKRVYHVVRDRAEAAGLGHVTPHDLRRSAAGILHHATTDDGGHQFDLLDIQKVLGHTDPATTMRSYLDPMDNAVQDRASVVLD